MTATKTQAPTVDAARASYLHGHHDPDRNMDHHTLSYLGNGATYTVTGYADGTATTCTCPSFTHSTRRPQTCKHCLAFVEMLERTEYERQAARSTNDLRMDEAWWMAQGSLTPDQRRAMNAIRAVLRARGVKSLATVARARQAAAELFGGAA